MGSVITRLHVLLHLFRTPALVHLCKEEKMKGPIDGAINREDGADSRGREAEATERNRCGEEEWLNRAEGHIEERSRGVVSNSNEHWPGQERAKGERLFRF